MHNERQTNGIDFIHEDDTWLVITSIAEHLANESRTFTNVLVNNCTWYNLHAKAQRKLPFYTTKAFIHQSKEMYCTVLLAFLDPRVGHTIDVLSPFISVLCHSDWLFHGESCPRLDVVHPGRAWLSSPACTWHCSLHYLFLQATPLFPHGVTIVC